MPELLYPTTCEIEGPILLDWGQLSQLDKLIDEHVPQLVERQDEKDRKEVERHLQEWLKKNQGATEKELEQERIHHGQMLKKFRSLLGRTPRVRELTVQFTTGKRLVVQSFAEAAVHPEVNDDLAVGFQLHLHYEPVELRMEASSGFRHRLRIEVQPEDNEGARSLYGGLRQWLNNVAPPKWQQTWVRWHDLVFLLWIFWAVLSLAIPLVGAQLQSKAFYKEEARKLLEEGVRPENEARALETILALLSDKPSPKAYALSARAIFFMIGGLVVCLVVSFPPKIILGLGKGQQRIAAWRWWLRLVFVAIPAFIASNFLWPTVVDIVSRALSSTP